MGTQSTGLRDNTLRSTESERLLHSTFPNMSTQPWDTEPVTLLQDSLSKDLLLQQKNSHLPPHFSPQEKLQRPALLVFPTPGSLPGYREGIQGSIYPKK